MIGNMSFCSLPRNKFRLRISKYRVLLIEDRDAQTYVITTIGPRGDIYK